MRWRVFKLKGVEVFDPSRYIHALRITESECLLSDAAGNRGTKKGTKKGTEVIKPPFVHK